MIVPRVLRESNAGLPRRDLPLALVSGNLGVEIGQPGFIVVVLRDQRTFHVLHVRQADRVKLLPGGGCCE